MTHHSNSYPLESDKKCQMQDIQRVGKELLITMRSDPKDRNLLLIANGIEHHLDMAARYGGENILKEGKE